MKPEGNITRGRTHLIFGHSNAKRFPAGEHLNGEDAHGPRVQRLGRPHSSLAAGVGRDNLRCSVDEAEAGAGEAASVCRAPKVDECPAVAARQPHDVAGLDVAVHVPRSVQVLQPLRHMRQNLQKHPRCVIDI